MKTSEASTPLPRLQSVDAVRGVAMVLMAIDHIRDFLDRRAMHFSPTDLARTSTSLFLTRWITHFCAPVFIFTAGISAYLWISRGHHSKGELSRFLVTRGWFLICLELTAMRLIMFSAWPFAGSPILLIILWAIGVSMIALALLARLPVPFLAIVSLTVIACHNLLDAVPAARFGSLAWVWRVLHQPGLFHLFGITFISAYPVLPWIAVMALGFCFGHTYDWKCERRRGCLRVCSYVMIAAFFVLRGSNSYGDPAKWSEQSSHVFTVLSFLDVTKYPPSLDFLLMTLGPALLALALFERIRFSDRNPLIVFGRVPLFYYVSHILLARLLSVILNVTRYGWKPFVFLAPPSMGSLLSMFPADYGTPLWMTYLAWLLIIAVLYPACFWYASLKRSRRYWLVNYL